MSHSSHNRPFCALGAWTRQEPLAGKAALVHAFLLIEDARA